MHPQEYVTAQDVARASGLALDVVYYHIRVKNLPATKFGDQYAIKSADLKEFVRRKALHAYLRRPGRPRKLQPVEALT